MGHERDEPPGDFGLPTKVAEGSGLELDRLTAAMADLLSAGDDPYAQAPGDASQLPGERDAAGAEACEITPRTILEAMLFVGSPTGEPLASKQVAGLMRGVRPAEIDAAIRHLNRDYERRNCPYAIASEKGGYRLQLRPQYDRLRDKVYGRTRQARLSQAAIEVLAAVAYHEPVTAEEVTRLRGAASGHVIAQLVRRQLLRLERGGDGGRRVRYATTARFLALFGLESLADLPKSGELEAP